MTKKLKSIRLIVENCMQCSYSHIIYGDEYGKPISTTLRCHIAEKNIVKTTKGKLPKTIKIPAFCPLDDVESA